MGLLNWLRRLFLGDRAGTPQGSPTAEKPAPGKAARRQRLRRARRRLTPLRASDRDTRRHKPGLSTVEGSEKAAYRFARPCVTGGWLDLSRDGDSEKLRNSGLPVFHTPADLAEWLRIPLGKLAWLVHRFDAGQVPSDQRSAHYHFHWLKKRSGGNRLIESPKPLLKSVQRRILREILDNVPPHAAAHGFVAGRSIRSNAAPHTGQRVILKFDLENFYPSVSFARVVALLRSLGYSRESAIWLGRLCTSRPPSSAIPGFTGEHDIYRYSGRHLPQGAPTSPALANLSAYSLDLRLAGLARTFDARYTRYADDLTFSGDQRFRRSLAVFIPLVEQIVVQEKFRTNRAKRRVVRDNQRQQVTGVVVNRRPNIGRREHDRLKAILVNCIRRGPSTQNHQHHDDFAAHLRGSIAHVSHLNDARGKKLLGLFQQIDWKR